MNRYVLLLSKNRGGLSKYTTRAHLNEMWSRQSVKRAPTGTESEKNFSLAGYARLNYFLAAWVLCQSKFIYLYTLAQR
jgi:hypothetical protein